MSGRKLGGGRILGSGKGLAPPAPPPPQPQQHQHQHHGSVRAPSPFAASEVSSISSGSHNQNTITPPTSSSPLPDFSQDLAANISLDAPSPSNAGAGGLVCPICQEEMLTLLQLNRHIDDMHQELPQVQHDEVMTWIDKQVLKAKKLQPLSLLSQKLRGLEVFESNEDPIINNNVQSSAHHSSSSNATVPRVVEPSVIDPDDLITKKHWQRSTGGDSCTELTCDRRLGPLSGSINCRKCGLLFCEEHTMYQMRLSPRTATHDPARGHWYRVCETCYKSREGYNDHNGLITDHTAAFVAIRKQRVERQNLDIARLEKRLTKLTQLLASPLEEVAAMTPGAGGLLTSPIATLAGQKSTRKAIEQSVVTWEDDASVARCPFCQQEFGSWTFRRHHCRICGRVVCADPQTGCSAEIGLNVASVPQRPSLLQQNSSTYSSTSLGPLRSTALEKRLDPGAGSQGQISVSVRMCRDCSTTIFSKRDVAASIAYKPADQRAYENLRQFERGIRSLMPSFQRSLLALQPPDPNNLHALEKPPPTHAQIQEAAKIRKRLMDAFAKYNLAAKRLRDLPTDNPAQKKLQLAVHAAASTFLHTHMLPLKSVPHMLRSSSSSKPSSAGQQHRRMLSGLNHGNGLAGHLSPLRNGETLAGDGDASSVAGSEVSTAASALETEEKELRERLVVLEEQRFLVQDMVNNARGARRFEEVGALSGNLEELDREIATLKRQVAGVEEKWEGLYATGQGTPGAAR
ncbi:vacuolar segregation protein pep7 [Pyricularia oryzae 70-15]|uniref:Vacuolar segregation protein pep7 n=1 Tax=Pyricularia oryzae (strain 70-15 / ATCC MYA-4617 / FGSC 8958) TaxID=242507 RepID=G4NIH8_PYRO7|nr:vacuolar segregation protein pep7 [Pyricularia oryzae 70-15]EHA48038.1 vacuolar segregation protein pep7 [Pyricularia oryzae 70-15]KAI7912404.1 vacuolar segregation protein pep7 [Pyricularia oryzae]